CPNLVGQVCDHPKCRRSRRQLVEFRVDAAELAGAMREARIDLRAAHRERPSRRPDSPEALAAPLRRAQHLDIDLGLEHLLHAAHEAVAVLLVRVDERARAVETRRGVDDLLAVDLALSALDLVLRPQREWE